MFIIDLIAIAAGAILFLEGVGAQLDPSRDPESTGLANLVAVVGGGAVLASVLPGIGT